MKSPPKAPVIQLPIPPDVSLRVKDSLRELRSTARSKAKTLANRLTESEARAPAWAPPIGEMAQLALGAVAGLDRLAVDLVSADHAHRSLNFKLLSLTQLEGGDGGKAQGREFELHLYWVLKHLLSLTGEDGVTVLQEPIHQASLHVRRQLPKVLGDRSIEPDPEQALASRMAWLALALLQYPPLRIHGAAAAATSTVMTQEAEQSLTLAERMVVAATLAGEIAQIYPDSNLQKELNRALQMSLRIVESRQPELRRALDAAQPQARLQREFAFIMRHA